MKHFDFYLGEQTDITVIYLHGGSLIYGERSDLPQSYREVILAAGFNFLALDYPLLPGFDYAESLTTLENDLQHFWDHYQDLGATSPRYLFLGRSAGAYLAFQLASRQHLPQPETIVDFYGFSSLYREEFQEPNPHYLTFPLVKTADIATLLPQRLTASSNRDRFLLYLYYRQQGTWLKMIQPKEVPLATDLSLAYIVHSLKDPDVSFQAALALKKQFPEAELLYQHADQHDFDRESTPEMIQLYQQIFTKLKERFT